MPTRVPSLLLPNRFAHEMPFGAHYLGQGRTRFSLWAPAARIATLQVIGEFGDVLVSRPMEAGPQGWFHLEAPLPAGTRYRYGVQPREGGAQLAVPDPASRAQAGDVHDPSLVTDPRGYAWQHPDWAGRPWEEAVVYELHPGACGGFAGIAGRLEALAALGVTAIELMPIADFPGPRNWGYDGVLPYAPDAAYGTPEDLKRLVDKAHGLGLMVLLDVVYNHFGPDGNYWHRLAPGFFRDDVRTGWGAAIDFRQEQVREFFTHNALYWIEEFRFDGLRLDAVHAIHDGEDWLRELAQRVRAAAGPQRQVHLVLEHEDNHAGLLAQGFDAQWNDDIHHVLHHLLTGEDAGYYGDYAQEPARKLARALAEGFVYQGEPSPLRDGKPRGQPSAQLPPTRFVAFLQNHDQIGNRAFGERLQTLAAPAALEAALALLLLAPQIPLLFMGEEWGSESPFQYFTSHTDPQLAEAVREGRRKEFAHSPGFADAGRQAQIPDPNAHSTFQASVPAGDDGPAAAARRELVGRLLALRRERIVPRLRGSRTLGAAAAGAKAVVARWRMGDGGLLSIALNLAEHAVQLDAEAEAAALLPAQKGDAARLLFATAGAEDAFDDHVLPGQSFIAVLEGA